MKMLKIPLFDALEWLLKPRANLTLMLVLVTGPYEDWPNEEHVAWALRQVESGDKWDKVGAAGELGAYQFMPATWRRYTTAAFANAADPVLGEIIARIHLRTIMDRIERKGGRPTVRKIAQAWNPRAPRDYAQRVENLVKDRKAKK